MPTYTFRNTETGEIFEEVLRMSEYDSYKQSHPTHERYYDGTAPAMAYRIGTPKSPGGFKDVLNTIHERTPGSTLKNNTTGNIGG